MESNLILNYDGVDILINVKEKSFHTLQIVVTDLYHYQRWVGDFPKQFFEQFGRMFSADIAWSIATSGFKQSPGYSVKFLRPEELMRQESNTMYLILTKECEFKCKMPFPVVNVPFTNAELISIIKNQN